MQQTDRGTQARSAVFAASEVAIFLPECVDGDTLLGSDNGYSIEDEAETTRPEQSEYVSVIDAESPKCPTVRQATQSIRGRTTKLNERSK